MRVYRQAKDYVKAHESEIQQALAHDKSFASQVKHFKIMIFKLSQMLWKLLRELMDRLIPWQQRIKGQKFCFHLVNESPFSLLF